MGRRGKHNYPKNRKSPRKHAVKGYRTSDGVKVKGHKRGRGK